MHDELQNVMLLLLLLSSTAGTAMSERVATVNELAAMNSWAEETAAALEAQSGSELLRERLSSLGEFSLRTYPRLIQSSVMAHIPPASTLHTQPLLPLLPLPSQTSCPLPLLGCRLPDRACLLPNRSRVPSRRRLPARSPSLLCGPSLHGAGQRDDDGVLSPLGNSSIHAPVDQPHAPRLCHLWPAASASRIPPTDRPPRLTRDDLRRAATIGGLACERQEPREW